MSETPQTTVSTQPPSLADDKNVDELPTIFDPTTCVRKGLCPVSKTRNKRGKPRHSHEIYFEQHGNGKEKILFVMGLNTPCFSWLGQVEHLKQNIDKYSLLVFDNRGVGNSGIPSGPYSMKGMAQDVVCLLDYLGWTAKRDFHVVAMSLGGMIALELAASVPERIISLLLGVTTPGGHWWQNIPPWKGLSALLRSMFIRDVDKQMPFLLKMGYTKEWLDTRDEDDPQGRLNRVIEAESFKRMTALAKPLTAKGSFSQMYAGFVHRVPPSSLRKIDTSIPLIILAVGDQDVLISTNGTRRLSKAMKSAEVVHYEDAAHTIHIQKKKEMNRLIERMVEEGRRKVEQLSVGEKVQ